ncbi:hypothetical protein FBULB1_12078 [Fusarium bulbicola]|nr:hypothetical protein FBULB1_12078 [Fusarium bulbicola]
MTYHQNTDHSSAFAAPPLPETEPLLPPPTPFENGNRIDSTAMERMVSMVVFFAVSIFGFLDNLELEPGARSQPDRRIRA